jgi:ABC-2 type transport system permease protein
MAADVGVQPSTRIARGRAIGSPAWRGFLATFSNSIKGFYREPRALLFTLGQPFILLLILNTFHFHITLPNGETRPYLDRLLPGMMAFNGMTVGLNSIAFSLIRDKERGILRRVRATPIPTASFLGGIILSRLVITLAVMLVTYASGVYIFGAHVSGNVPLLLAVSELGAAIFIPIGILMVAVAKTEDAMPPMFMLVLMPSMLFSGAFLDRSGLPHWLAWSTNGLPLTFLTHAVQHIATLGAGFQGVRGDVLALVVWGVATAALASWKFKLA